MAVNSIQIKMKLNDDYYRQMFEKLNQAKDNNKFCDVELVADDGTRISAHRLVLFSASDYFAAMFTGPLKESKETEIALHDIPGDVLQSLIQICYTGVIEVGADDVERILKHAVMYQFSDIVKMCSDFLTDQLQPSNSLGVALLADHLSLMEFAQAAWSYSCANFLDVNQNDEFMELSHIELTKLLTSEDLTVNAEEDVFNCVEAWVKHNSSERIKYIVSLLPHIRLPLIKQRFLSERVSPFCNQVPCLEALTKCQQLLINAFKYQSLPPLTPEQIVTARKLCHTRLLLIRNLNNIEIYDPLKVQWTNLKLNGLRFKEPRLSCPSYAIMDNKLLIIGGKDSNGEAVSRVECIDFNKMTSVLLPSLNEGRYNSSVGVVNGIVYCIGGYGNNEIKKTVERYDQNTCKWVFVAPMNVARRSAAVSVIENEIYIVGGDTRNGPTSSMECYDTKTDIWRDCAPMSESYSQIAAGAINGFIYAIGGNNNNNNNRNSYYSTNTCAFYTFGRYDPHLNKWEPLANLTDGYYYLSAAVLRKQLIIASYNGGLKNVQQYNPDENKWTTLTSFNAGTGSESFAIIPVSERFLSLK